VVNIEKTDIEEIIFQMKWCDLITEDEISGFHLQFKSLPRCYDYPNKCSECDTKVFLENSNYEEFLERYGSKIRYNLKKGKWEMPVKPNLLENTKLISNSK